MIRKRKEREPRETSQPHVIKWESSNNGYRATTKGYVLKVVKYRLEEFWWDVHNEEDTFYRSGTKTTLQQAKNAAVFQMNKHKKSLIRKTVNNCQ